MWARIVSISLQPRLTRQQRISLDVRQADARFCGDIVDFETFSKILNRPGGFREPGEPEEYCRGFQVFDKDMSGFIGVGQLRYILTNLGEKMSDDEVDELLKAVDTSSGEINYTGELSSYNLDHKY
jgi:Ca2+-binding EF-hand superfamily protein